MTRQRKGTIIGCFHHVQSIGNQYSRQTLFSFVKNSIVIIIDINVPCMSSHTT